jgi:hypothetical protein
VDLNTALVMCGLYVCVHTQTFVLEAEIGNKYY